MIMTVRVGYRFHHPFVLLILCLLVIPVVHAEQNPDPDSALGMVVENINNAMNDVLEPKRPATSDYYTLMEYGDTCAKRGDYKNALGYYNAALDRVESTSDKTLVSTANAHRASIYQRKTGVYRQQVRMPYCNSNLRITPGRRSPAGPGLPGRDDPHELCRIAVC